MKRQQKPKREQLQLHVTKLRELVAEELAPVAGGGQGIYACSKSSSDVSSVG